MEPLEDRLAPAAGNILVSQVVSGQSQIREYTSTGTLVASSIVPHPGDDRARDIIVDSFSNRYAFNGTFDPYLSIQDARTGAWTNQTFSGWSTIANGTYGGIAILDSYVFVTDMRTFGDGGADEAEGIVRFDLLAGTAARFATGIGFIDLTVGLNGKLYGLSGNGEIRVFDPETVTLERTIQLQLGIDYRAIAVNAAGDLFVALYDEAVRHLDSNGQLINSLHFSGTFESSPQDLYDIDVSTDGWLVVGSRFGTIALLTEALTDVSYLTVSGEGVFVCFATSQFGTALPPRPSVSTPAVPFAVNADTTTIEGTAAAGSLVQIYRDDNNDGFINGADSVVASQQLVAESTDFSLSVPLSQDIANNFVVTARDDAGNESVPQDVPIITEDSTPPPAPVVSTPGNSLSVNANTTTIAGTATVGSLVQIYRDDNNDGLINGADAVVASQQLASGNTNFSMMVALVQDAPNNFLVTARDGVGNESVARDVPTITEDSTPPLSPVVSTPATPFAVNANTTTIVGTAETGSLIQIYRDNNDDGLINGTDSVVASQQLSAGATSFSLVVSLTQNVDNYFLVTARDAASNVSTPQDVPTINEDSVSPPTPVVSTPTTAFAVNADTATITGTAEAGTVVQVYRDNNNDGLINGADSVVASQQLAAGITNFSVAAPLSQDAANNFVVVARDAAGNASSPRDVPTITEDSMPPPAPAVNTPATPLTVNANTATIAGTAAAGSFVQIYRDNNNDGLINDADAVVVSQQLTPGAVNFSLTVALFQDVVNNFLVTARDAVSNESVPRDVATITEDSTAPVAPSMPDLAALSDTGSSNTDNVTRNNMPALVGTSEAGTTVTILRDGVPAGSGVAVGGIYSITLPATADGTYLFTARATDTVGNVSVVSNGLTVTIDTVAPTVTVEQAPAQADPAREAPIAFMVTFSEAVVDFTATDVALSGLARPTTASVTGSGPTFTVAVSGMSQPGTVQAAIAADQLTDAAGNGNIASTSSDNLVHLGALIVTGSDAGGEARVRMWDSAASHTEIYSFVPYAGFTGGVRVALADVTGDQIPDLITAPGKSLPGGALVQVFDGAALLAQTEHRVHSFRPYGHGYFGEVFVAAGDFSGDGRAEIVTGNSVQGPVIRVFGGVDAARGQTNELDTFQPFGSKYRGGVRVAVGDVNGDRVPDIIAGQSRSGSLVRVFSGADFGVRLTNIVASPTAIRGGVFVAAGDLDGDQVQEIIIGNGAGASSVVRAYKDVSDESVAGRLFQKRSLGFGKSGIRLVTLDIDADAGDELLAVAGPGIAQPVRVLDNANLAIIDEFFAEASPFNDGQFLAAAALG